MMRKSLYAVLVGTTLFSCAKKPAEPSATERGGATAVAAAPRAAADGARDGDSRPGRPMAPPPAHAGAGSGMAVTAGGPTTADPGDRELARATAPSPAGAAGVRAGEWDDNANYRDYVKWLAETSRAIPRLEVSDRQFLIVKDKDGKPVPNCKIDIESAQAKASLVTMASGRALWFPHAYGASGKLSATAHCGQHSVSAEISGQLDTVTQLVLATARELPARRSIDLAFVLDTTGSMGEEIEAVKHTIKAVAAQLSTDQADVRIGLVEYKDRSDNLVTKAYGFSSDLAAFSRSISGLAASGGGDTPEDMQQGLSVAIDKLQWRRDAVARMIVVIADAPPHLDYQDEQTFAASARLAASRGIKLFTVSASGMDDTGQLVMRQLAQFTGASNMFVLRGGAGPESVGGGDPKSSCGGTQEQYASGKLDRLILGKVRQELASVDADPTRIAGLGKDESAKPCDQRVVMAY